MAKSRAPELDTRQCVPKACTVRSSGTPSKSTASIISHNGLDVAIVGPLQSPSSLLIYTQGVPSHNNCALSCVAPQHIYTLSISVHIACGPSLWTIPASMCTIPVNHPRMYHPCIPSPRSLLVYPHPFQPACVPSWHAILTHTIPVDHSCVPS